MKRKIAMVEIKDEETLDNDSQSSNNIASDHSSHDLMNKVMYYYFIC